MAIAFLALSPANAAPSPPHRHRQRAAGRDTALAGPRRNRANPSHHEPLQLRPACPTNGWPVNFINLPDI